MLVRVGCVLGRGQTMLCIKTGWIDHSRFANQAFQAKILQRVLAVANTDTVLTFFFAVGVASEAASLATPTSAKRAEHLTIVVDKLISE